jgi:hypothetical protein
VVLSFILLAGHCTWVVASRRARELNPATAELQSASRTSEMRAMVLPPGVEPSSRPSEGQQQIRYRKQARAWTELELNQRRSAESGFTDRRDQADSRLPSLGVTAGFRPCVLPEVCVLPEGLEPPAS